jgi:hypothetical protein
VNRAFDNKGLRGLNLSWGYQSKFEAALKEAGFVDTAKETKAFYDAMETWAADMIDMEYFSNTIGFMKAFESMANYLLDDLFETGRTSS